MTSRGTSACRFGW